MELTLEERNALVLSCNALVWKLALKIANSMQMYSAVDDLAQEGQIGLIVAAKKFEPQRGLKFITFALPWARAYIAKWLEANWGVVRQNQTQALRNAFWGHKIQRDFAFVAVDYGAEGASDGFDSDIEDSSPSAQEELERHEYFAQIDRIISNFRQSLSEIDKIVLDQRILTDPRKKLKEVAGIFNLTTTAIGNRESKLRKKLKELFSNDPEFLRTHRLYLDKT